MQLCSITSGSSGNCIYVGSDNTHIIVDAGVSGKKIEAGLNSIGLKTGELDGILITHEHSDHISGLGVLARRYGIPMYATAGTIEAIKKCRQLGKILRLIFIITHKHLKSYCFIGKLSHIIFLTKMAQKNSLKIIMKQARKELT